MVSKMGSVQSSSDKSLFRLTGQNAEGISQDAFVDENNPLGHVVYPITVFHSQMSESGYGDYRRMRKYVCKSPIPLCNMYGMSKLTAPTTCAT